MGEILGPIFTGLVSKYGVEAYKKANMSITEKLSRNDNLNLAMLIQMSEHAVEQLEKMNLDFKAAIDRHHSMTTTHGFESWRDEVSRIIEPVRSFITKHEKGKQWPIILPDFWSKTKKKTLEQLMRYMGILVPLLETGLSFFQNSDSFLVHPPPEKVIKINNVPEIKGFPSLQSRFEETLTLLNRSNITCIAIHGMMGFGKTTVLANLNNCQQVAKLFDMVIFLDGGAVVSDEKLQRAIAERIQLDGDITANSISRALNKYKKCLLLLDDVRTELSTVCELELPLGSKVVLTARSEFARICQPMVDIVTDISSLTRNEEWKMFQKVVGEDVINKPGIKKEAREVSSFCCRIPIVIKTIASCFKRSHQPGYWRAELRKLKLQKKHKMKGVEEIYTYWMSCYEQMMDDIVKKCFLYSALRPAGRKICTQHLIESWTQEGFIDSEAKPMIRREMLDEGQVVLTELTELAFLEKHDEKMMFVEMNSAIQEFALYVQSEADPNCRIIVKTGATDQSPAPEDWEQASHRISMVDNSLCELPNSTSCKNLLTLLLQRNSRLGSIPLLFFQKMERLVLLDLYKTSITVLPSSVSNLIALKALYLNDCKQLTLLPPEIKQLKCLEVLDIRDTKVYFIPEEIWSLVNLKSLRTSYTEFSSAADQNQKQVKDHNVALELPLEELVISVKFYLQWCDVVNDVIKLVAGLKTLSSLKFCFPDAETLQAFVGAPVTDVMHNLSSFHFFVGCESKCPEITDNLDNIVKYLRYCDHEKRMTDKIQGVLARSQALELIGLKDVTTLSDLGTNSFKSIYGCLIESCDEMKTVSEVREVGNMLPHLEQLYLRNMRSLTTVVYGDIVSNRWGLKILELKSCHELTDLVSQGAIEILSQLEKLVVEDCSKIEKFCVMLPKLQTLRLLKLEQLKTVSEDEAVNWPSLEVLEINECPRLTRLQIFTEDKAPKLRVLEGEQLLKWRRTQQT